MAKPERTAPTQRQALNADVEHEIDIFAERARRENALEAVMRLRALLEISGQLDTEKLLALAVSLSSEMSSQGRSKAPPRE